MYDNEWLQCSFACGDTVVKNEGNEAITHTDTHII